MARFACRDAEQAQHPDHKPRFKPGWKTRKKETDINPWKERVAFEEGKAKEFEKYQEHKKAVLQERSSKYVVGTSTLSPSFALRRQMTRQNAIEALK